MFLTTFDENAKLWYGRDVPPLYSPKVSLAQVLLSAMKTFGNKIAQINDESGYETSFNEMRIKTICAAQNLQALGYQPKQVFGLMARNSRNVAPIIFASMAIGCPVNTLDPSFDKSVLIHMLGITKPVLMFCDKSCYALLKECLNELGNEAKIYTFGGCDDGSELVENLFQETFKENEFLPVKVDGENDIAMIVCSSGTTGLSKGVCLSHAALLNAHTQYTINLMDIESKVLCFSSLYWCSGLNMLIAGTLSGATRIITTEVFSPDLQFQLIEKYKITFMFSAPFHGSQMMKSDKFHKTNFSSLKTVILRGGRVPLHLKNTIQNVLKNGFVHVGMGMSEIACAVAYDIPATCKDTIGRIGAGNCVKIIDDMGNRCGVNEEGELCIKIKYKILGYYGNHQATAEAIDHEGFFKTGDIVRIDEDGDLIFIDRKKDLLRYNGVDISSSIIDAYLIQSPTIQSACVVGLPGMDGMGDLVCAAIIRAKGSEISEQDVFDQIADHFPDSYKLRGGVYFMDSFPTTPSGKIQRRKVREMVIELNKVRCKN